MSKGQVLIKWTEMNTPVQTYGIFSIKWYITFRGKKMPITS